MFEKKKINKKPYGNKTCALDVDVDKPDEKSIMTYVAQFLKHHPDSAETDSVRHEEEVRSFLAPLTLQLLFPPVVLSYVTLCNARV